MSVSFDQAHQFLTGEIDESQLVTYVPEPKELEVPKTEQESTETAQTKSTPTSESKEDVIENTESAVQSKRGFFSWLFGRK